MKNNLLIVCFLVILSACSKNNEPAAPPGSYSDNKGTWVNVTNARWYLTRNTIGGGYVNLSIAGSTNADKITVQTSGDGALSDVVLMLDNKNFSQDLVISFSATSVPANNFVRTTKVIAYRGKDMFPIILSSDPLKY